MFLSALVQPVEAQQRDATRARRAPAARSTGQQPAATPGDTKGVRAELAAVLLQSRRYDEAAREYRLLVGRDPGNLAHRLGLARALAWGKRPREAEHELRILRARRPNDREVEALLRSVRESYEPDVQEASDWLAERPGYTPYRRALARALMRAGDPVSAIPHYDRLLLADSSISMRREVIYAQVAAGDYERAVRLLNHSLARVPHDTALRHTLASVLYQAGDHDQALREYDTLIRRVPTAALLLERAQLQIERRDLAAAEADVNASVLARPNSQAYLLMGNLQRWRGDFTKARSAYERARMLDPKNDDINTALARLGREERPIAAFVPTGDDDEGWTVRSTGVGDNIGMTYATLGIRRAEALDDNVIGTIEVEARRLAEDTIGLNAAYPGVALGVGLAYEFSDGAFLGRLGGRGGVVLHDDATELTGALSATGWYMGWGFSLEIATGPAYPTLLTAAAIRPPDVPLGVGALPLREVTAGVALGGPLGDADMALSLQQSTISDGNLRMIAQAVLRVPLVPQLAVLGAASGIWFAQRSPLYWDPQSYIAVAGGLELATRRPRGVSFAARALVGPAHSVEEVEGDLFELEEVSLSATQLSGSAELSYRSDKGEVGAAASYGDGRAGQYRRLEVSLFARLR